MSERLSALKVYVYVKSKTVVSKVCNLRLLWYFSQRFQEDFRAVADKFEAIVSSLYIPGITPQKRLGIIISKKKHCLVNP
jgi:formyltetrahydrofolate hydrolase